MSDHEHRLPAELVREIHASILKSGVQTRSILKVLPPEIRALIPESDTESERLLMALNSLNDMSLADGTVPLREVLLAAHALLQPSFRAASVDLALKLLDANSPNAATHGGSQPVRSSTHRFKQKTLLLSAVALPAAFATAFAYWPATDSTASCLDKPSTTPLSPAHPGVLHEKTGVELVRIPAGNFKMGAPYDEGYDDEHPSHNVNISAFELAKYPVTVEQFARYLVDVPGAERPGKWDEQLKHAHNPVVNVSWGEAQLYASWAELRLPTEAEREYAARAGTLTPFSSGSDTRGLGEVAWYDGNSGHHIHAVCEKKANAFGLYDMHGNVWEWCSNWYDSYDTAMAGEVDPHGPPKGNKRVFRGGYWNSPPNDVRSASRDSRPPEMHFEFLGFRLARDLGASKGPSNNGTSAPR